VPSVPVSATHCFALEVDAACRECTPRFARTSVIPGSLGSALAIPAPYVMAAMPTANAPTQRTESFLDSRVPVAMPGMLPGGAYGPPAHTPFRRAG